MNIQFRDVVKRYTGPNEALGRDGAGTVTGIPVDGGNGGVVQAIVAGTGIDVDDTDPANPIVTATGVQSDGTVTLLVALTQEDYDLLDPPDPTTVYVIVG